MKKSTLSNENSPYLAEINVIPYVDVVLVLLVIFMITAPILQQGVSVDLPKTPPNSTLETPNINNVPIVIAATKENTFKIKGYKDIETKSPKAIVKVIAANFADKNNAILIQGDRNAPYGNIVKLFVELRNTGYKKVQLITRPDDKL